MLLATNCICFCIVVYHTTKLAGFVATLGIPFEPATVVSAQLAKGSELITCGTITMLVQFTDTLMLPIQFCVLYFGMYSVSGIPFFMVFHSVIDWHAGGKLIDGAMLYFATCKASAP